MVESKLALFEMLWITSFTEKYKHKIPLKVRNENERAAITFSGADLSVKADPESPLWHPGLKRALQTSSCHSRLLAERTSELQIVG